MCVVKLFIIAIMIAIRLFIQQEDEITKQKRDFGDILLAIALISDMGPKV